MSTVVAIPVVFVSGLLGSGKSTTTASLLDSRRYGSVGVVIQDLADSNIDLGLLQGGETLDPDHQDWIEPADDSVHAALTRLLQRGNFDAVIVESSGAIPLNSVIHDSRLHEIPNVRYAGSIAVLDARHMLHTADAEAIPAGLQATICAADLLLLNKIDLVPLLQRGGLQAHTRRLVHKIGCTAPLRATRFGRVSLNELLQSLPPVPRVNPAVSQPLQLPPLAHGVFSSSRPFASEQIYNWLQRITETPPQGLLRAKGFFYIDSLPDYILVFDVVQKHIEIGIEGVWWAAVPAAKRPAEAAAVVDAGGVYADRKQELVFIGDDLDVDTLIRELQDMLCDDFREPDSEDPMHNALRKQLAQLKSKKSGSSFRNRRS